MRVYHGSSEIVEKPDVVHSYRSLDFGKGFYVTSNEDQAVKWAKRKAELTPNGKAYVNCYELKDTYDDLLVKTFPEDLTEWIDFVCRCRDGETEYSKFDLIIGKVANDKVFRVVDLYREGIWDKQRALEEIKAYPDYDQIAFITQKAINKLLSYDYAKEV